MTEPTTQPAQQQLGVSQTFVPLIPGTHIMPVEPPAEIVHRKLIAEVISFRLGHTGIVVRDAMGRSLCRLDMREVAFENDQDARAAAERLVNEIAALIEQRNHTTAPLLDKHR